MRRSALLACVLAAPLFWVRLDGRPDPTPGLPRIMLWAWESPQDLRFVEPGRAGIAFLSRTVWLDGTRVWHRPRLQPLRFNPGTDLMAVVRFESAGHGLPDHTEVVKAVLPALDVEGVRALQIDFDARQSEREWYGEFLRGLRGALPAKIPLTITALESWCEAPQWVDGLPVNDAVAMLFRMGPGEHVPGASFDGKCRSSIGVSTDEMPVRVPRARRVYIFHPGPWTQEAYDAAAAQSWRWRK